LDLAKATDALLKKPVINGPKTDDELHSWIIDKLGIDVPRVSVCPGHDAPFKFLSDIYFERVTTAIGIGNRGGSKTMISAILHLLNSLFHEGCESAQVGAVEPQARRAYTNMKLLLKNHGRVDHFMKHPMLVRSVERETEFNNGSKVEVLIGTPEGVNGPHPNKVAADEVELMDENAFQESRNMSQSKNGILAQDWITSTRKTAHGPMQKLLDENIEAERAGADPPYSVYTWCIFETAAKVPNCQVANPGCDSPCPCDRVVKGSWDDGSPRRFTDICKGRLSQSDGFLSLHDVHKTFRNTNQEIYEAQQLCTKPETAGLVFPLFERARHGIKWWDPDPSLGAIYQSVDYGSTNPSAVNWYQVIDFDVYAYGYYQQRNEDPKALLPEGTKICFDELYIADVGNVGLANAVVERENLWRKKHPNFRVNRRFADVQNRAGRIDWAQHDPPLLTSWFATRDVKEQIKVCRELFRENRIRVDVARCEMFCEEAEFYHYPKRISQRQDDPEIPVDDFNHVMSNFRYCMINLHVMERKRIKSSGIVRPAVGETKYNPRSGAGESRYLSRSGDSGVKHPLAGRVFE